MSRASRMFGLIQALRRRRRPVPAADLARELGVSTRTIYRDVVSLAALGAPIEGEAGLGYVLRPGFFLPPLMFGADEVDALILGLRFVAQRGDASLVQGARDALAKIAAVLPPEVETALAANGLMSAPGKPTAGGALLSAVRQALREEVTLRIDYVDKDGRSTERIVWPVTLGFFRDMEMLAAWCELRGGFRHFRLDRIRAAVPTGRRMPKRRRILVADWRLQENLDDLL